MTITPASVQWPSPVMLKSKIVLADIYFFSLQVRWYTAFCPCNYPVVVSPVRLELSCLLVECDVRKPGVHKLVNIRLPAFNHNVDIDILVWPAWAGAMKSPSFLQLVPHNIVQPCCISSCSAGISSVADTGSNCAGVFRHRCTPAFLQSSMMPSLPSECCATLPMVRDVHQFFGL